MRILLCNCFPIMDLRSGAVRVYADLANGLRENGIQFDFFPFDFPDLKVPQDQLEYLAYLAAWLANNAKSYDVIDYPIETPAWETESSSTASHYSVARCVLLPHHELEAPIPRQRHKIPPRIKRVARNILRIGDRRDRTQEILGNIDANLRTADLINVANSKDRECLLKLGVEAERILVLPYGLTDINRKALEYTSDNHQISSEPKRLVFVGTFDPRKGCYDLPIIFEKLKRRSPNLLLRMLGTAGLFQSEEQVSKHFPRALRKSLEIIPRFENSDLPRLLSGCDVGVFPSYHEGFGISIIEQLAAGIPVVAYNSPGPCDILPGEWLAPRGNVLEMIEILQIVFDEFDLNARAKAVGLSRSYRWRAIARETVDAYLDRRSMTRSYRGHVDLPIANEDLI